MYFYIKKKIEVVVAKYTTLIISVLFMHICEFKERFSKDAWQHWNVEKIDLCKDNIELWTLSVFNFTFKRWLSKIIAYKKDR